ncbi:MAG: tRNA pseudouridine(55) synthase TruB [Deltaproteobacteria bacterium]|nr:tRNA pseudouridine(55) synthase TruB [Deltaproteobacteria bacterium]
MARRKPALRHGVLAIDKPAGMTSRTLVNQVARLLGERRCGHAGTLDPDATGVLVICFGEATGAVRWLMGASKRYVTTARFGSETTTDDAEGAVRVAAASPDLREPTTCAALITAATLTTPRLVPQIPPAVSALKRDGVRDHERVRRGEIVEREPRPVWLHESAVLQLRAESDEADIALVVGSGFYVRAFCRDLGRELGSAAHMAHLRRTRCGGFATPDDPAVGPELGTAIGLDELAALPEIARVALLESVATSVGRILPTLNVGVLDPERAEALQTALFHGKRPVVPAHLAPSVTDEDDEVLLVVAADGVAIAVVAVEAIDDAWEQSGMEPDLRATGETGADAGRKLRVLRGFRGVDSP